MRDTGRISDYKLRDTGRISDYKLETHTSVTPGARFDI